MKAKFELRNMVLGVVPSVIKFHYINDTLAKGIVCETHANYNDNKPLERRVQVNSKL